MRSTRLPLDRFRERPEHIATMGRVFRKTFYSLLVLPVLVLGGVRIASTQAAGAATIRALPIGYAGVDYYDPTDYFTHCADYSWLQTSCYNNPSNPDPPRTQLISDLTFVTSKHLGSTQRVWISLDQLMRWHVHGGYAGFAPGTLQNVDDMLGLYHQFGVKVILVLYVYDRARRVNEFHAKALDGRHARMRRGYLRAEYAFLTHLAGNPIDVETAPIIELANEPYFQFEEYFNNPSHLGRFKVCDLGGHTDWGCVDTRIIHPWLLALYHTAETASSKFLYTFSDTGRMFENYAYWSGMYPEDLIDEHMYNSNPSSMASVYSQALHFQQPWIASEVGCDVGDIACTYNGSAAAPVDSWWLNNLAQDGAQAVLVDSHVTLWSYPNGPNSQTVTTTGQALQTTVANSVSPILPTISGANPPVRTAPTGGRATLQTISNNFDKLPLGMLRLPARANSFGIGAGQARMLVENHTAVGRQHALRITTGRSAFLEKKLTWTKPGFQLDFWLRLGADLTTKRNGYTVLAKVITASGSVRPVTTDLVLGGNRDLFLSFGVAGSSSTYLWGQSRLASRTWYHIVARYTAGRHGVALTVGRRTVAATAPTGLTLGSVRLAAVGDEYSSTSPATNSHLYLDDVTLAA